MTLTNEFVPLTVQEIPALAAQCKADDWRFVQIMAVNTENGIDLIYSFMKDGVLVNHEIKGVQKEVTIPSITDKFLAAFVFENEMHDLFGVDVKDIAIDFKGNFYALAQKEPMTIISPAVKAARDKAAKIAAAKLAKEKAAASANAAYVVDHPDAKATKPHTGTIKPSAEDELESRLAGVDPEKVARVRAAIAAKAKKATEEAAAATQKDVELDAKLAGMDPEKAAKVRAALEAKAAREQVKSDSKAEEALPVEKEGE